MSVDWILTDYFSCVTVNNKFGCWYFDSICCLEHFSIKYEQQIFFQ